MYMTFESSKNHRKDKNMAQIIMSHDKSLLNQMAETYYSLHKKWNKSEQTLVQKKSSKKDVIKKK